VQLRGEHVGIGDPPSAKEAVDIANVNSTVATSKRTIFFIIYLSSWLVVPDRYWETPYVYSLGRQATCSKIARFDIGTTVDGVETAEGTLAHGEKLNPWCPILPSVYRR